MYMHMNTLSQLLSSSRRQEGWAAVRKAGFSQMEASTAHRQLTSEEKREKKTKQKQYQKEKKP